MLRIFMSSTHTGAILQAIYAEKTHQDGFVDVLLLDYPPMKKSLINLIKRSDVIHKWDKIIDFSIPVSDETNKKPSLKKRLIRKLKTLPILKGFYDKLLIQHLVNQKQAHASKIKTELSHYLSHGVKLHVLTKTGLNECLFELFPEAEINYFEHGIGDYMYYEHSKKTSGDFYCLFDKEFKKFLESKGNKSSNNIKGYLEAGDFSTGINRLVGNGIITENPEVKNIQGELVFVLMENVEMYEVADSFWTDYIDTCLKKISSHEKFTFVIKPHHMQSFDAINITTNHLTKKGIKFIVLTNNHFMHMGAEVVFYFFSKQTKYVFSLFSSSVYYFTKLYPSNEIKYYHGYKLFERYTKKSPKQFTEIYKGLEPIISNVLAKDCLEL